MSWRAAFRDQADACRELGSAFTARLLDGFAARGLPPGPVASRIERWEGALGSHGISVPLRLAGALHGLVLEGRDPSLAAVYPPADLPEEEALWRAASAAILRHPDWIDARLDLAPQTNEVARAAALILVSHWLTARFGLPIRVSELGASAGLNLNFDRFRLDLPGGRFGPEDSPVRLAPEWRGSMVPDPCPPEITARRGVDLSPRDPVADRLRLLSFIWPDQGARAARISAALDLAGRHPAKVDRGDAIDWLDRRLSPPCPDGLHLVYHTLAWQYFPQAVRERGATLFAQAGALASREAPLARFAVEADGKTPGAGMVLTLWPGGEVIDCGRMDFHGRWIDWRAP
ncbi:DUF2332 domain-containing protein [Celeribacter indicus]|uniref:DUF2332 domain-containing protein n=1 Tax=Celeribacter indicus TaxID=1208324 RepID=A0A0B5DSN4_9RHOB|nr:DUF2332 family protein [Celeribacter indicus]AJE46054.1 hypothetical protein P73_1339 [Celeribacter indicus]SDX33811.1 hypothetical protein SAMN05443573_12256 [Celeribacter indicus]